MAAEEAEAGEVEAEEVEAEAEAAKNPRIMIMPIISSCDMKLSQKIKKEKMPRKHSLLTRVLNDISEKFCEPTEKYENRAENNAHQNQEKKDKA